MRNLTSLILFLGIIACILILSLSFNAHFWADDYYILERVTHEGMFSFMWQLYLKWDGRFISLNAIVQILLIRYTCAPVAVLVWSLMLVLTAWFMLKIFWIEQRSNRGQFVPIISLSVLFCLMWIGFSPHITETVYWATGGIYAMGLSMIFGFVYMFYNRPSEVQAKWVVGGIVLGLSIGLMGAAASFTVIVFLLIQIVLVRKEWRRNPIQLVYPLVWGAFIIVGTIFNIVAPGNYARASLLDTSFQWDLSLMMVNWLKITVRYLLFSWPAIAMALVAVVLVNKDIGKERILFFYTPGAIISRYGNFDFFLREFQWLLVALSCVLPMLVIPEFAGGRTTVFFMAFLFLWVWRFVAKILTPTNIKPIFCIRIRPGLILFAMGLLFCVIGFLAVSHFVTGYDIRKQVIEREAYLDAMKHQADTVKVKPIEVQSIPFSVYFVDRLDGPYARYFGYEKITLDYENWEGLPEYYKRPRW